MKIIVIRSEEGKITSKEELDKDMASVVKEVAERAFQEWDPSRSDFTVLRTKYDLEYSIPIDPDLLDVIEELGLEKEMQPPNKLIVKLPMVTISFDNEWIGESYYEKKMYIIAPRLDDNAVKQIEEYAIEATKEPKRLSGIEEEQLTLSEEELARLQEGLQEIEGGAEEGKKTKRRKRRSRKKSS